MSQSLFTLGFSPCPNDTFIFDSMVNEQEATPSYDFVLEDVETLNAYALEARLDISKMSFATYFQVSDQYQILPAGSALGFGVGPVLVSNKALNINDYSDLATYLADRSLGVPGRFTTAHLLLQLLYPDAKHKVFLPFDKIMESLEKGDIDVGLLIHEGRFTYKDAGFSLVADLGDAYQAKTGLPVPLGCIAIKKNLAEQYAVKVNQDIEKSLRKSWERYPVLSAFIQNNAQELDEDTMRKHIELYVNDETMRLSANALAAVSAFEKTAKSL